MLSGSTVFCQNVALPLKNLSVVHLDREDQTAMGPVLTQAAKTQEGPWVLALPGYTAPDYGRVSALAEELLHFLAGKPMLLCLEADMAKALGQALALRAGKDAEILCIDRVRLPKGSYLDVGAPVGPAFPVVVKTLVFGT